MSQFPQPSNSAGMDAGNRDWQEIVGQPASQASNRANIALNFAGPGGQRPGVAGDHGRRHCRRAGACRALVVRRRLLENERQGRTGIVLGRSLRRRSPGAAFPPIRTSFQTPAFSSRSLTRRRASWTARAASWSTAMNSARGSRPSCCKTPGSPRLHSMSRTGIRTRRSSLCTEPTIRANSLTRKPC
jgi:hypothetical protein